MEQIPFSFELNPHLYLKNPESSDLGKKIVKNAIDLIYELGFEHFTFKKLAKQISSTEATIYRYFENKHRLLLYILNWYWSYIDLYISFKIQNIESPRLQLAEIAKILVSELPISKGNLDYNKKFLNEITIVESSKAYFIKEIDDINKQALYQPYKFLCHRIALIISEMNAEYMFPHSLASTIIEIAHQQQFFAIHLPRLTDASGTSARDYTLDYINDVIQRIFK
jgi:AcrR family transcriptional regulator